MTKRLKQSAGLLMFRGMEDAYEVFLVHPGGPYWSKKDEGSWTLPKGEYEDGEEPLGAAQREFQEETGFIASAPFLELGSVRQKSGKVVLAWAFEGDCDPAKLVSNTCEVEWPPRSKKRILIPEVDRGAWFSPTDAAIFIREEQRPLLLRLEQQLRDRLK
jgi:predicted NUDIX family NTP pyrophosphohydrolase